LRRVDPVINLNLLTYMGLSFLLFCNPVLTFFYL